MKLEYVNSNMAIETIAKFTTGKDKNMISSPITISLDNIGGARPTLDDEGIISREFSNVHLKSGGEVTVDIPYSQSKTFVK